MLSNRLYELFHLNFNFIKPMVNKFAWIFFPWIYKLFETHRVVKSNYLTLEA